MPFVRDLFRLFFPAACCCCDTLLVGGEHSVCTKCLLSLPTTQFADIPDNSAEQRFLGRIPIQAATSLLYFNHHNITRPLIHSIKYQGNVELAHTMGRQMGIEFNRTRRFDDVDILVPIPLHRRKQRKRGYNQAQEICIGIAEVFPRPISMGDLVRIVNTKTQTHKNRRQRMDNMENVFEVRHPEALQNKHLLVVDDVMTSGATIEAACRPLLDIPGVSISIATLAMAGDF